MTKEKLLERKKDLQRAAEALTQRINLLSDELKQRITTRNANLVAIQEIDFWLAELENGEKTE